MCGREAFEDVQSDGVPARGGPRRRSRRRSRWSTPPRPCKRSGWPSRPGGSRKKGPQGPGSRWATDWDMSASSPPTGSGRCWQWGSSPPGARPPPSLLRSCRPPGRDELRGPGPLAGHHHRRLALRGQRRVLRRGGGPDLPRRAGRGTLGCDQAGAQGPGPGRRRRAGTQRRQGRPGPVRARLPRRCARPDHLGRLLSRRRLRRVLGGERRPAPPDGPARPDPHPEQARADAW